MRLGISSYTYTWAIGVPGHPPEHPMQVEDLLKKAAELGVQVVQIADNLPLHHLSFTEVETLKQQASTLKLQIEVGTRGIHPEHLRTYLNLAVELKSPILRVVADRADHHPSEQEIIDTFNSLLPEFERAGVILAIENHDRFKAATLIHILDHIPGNSVGICLDTVNSFGALEGPEVVVKTLGPRVVNLHIKDFTIFRASHLMGFTIEGCPAGQGQLNVPWMLNELNEVGRDLNAILELWTPPENTLAETIAKEEAWAVQSIEYLRQLIPV